MTAAALPLEPAGLPRFRLALIREGSEDYEVPESMNRPELVARWIQRRLARWPQEVMAAVALDTRNRPIAYAELFRGTLNKAAVEPRPILQFALLLNAAAVIIAHNHPSGDATPSAEDLAFTRRMAEAGETVGVRLVDHVIAGAQGYVSLKERGAF